MALYPPRTQSVRKKADQGIDNGATYGSFSGGAATSSASWGAISASSASPSVSSSASSNGAGSNTRSDNNTGGNSNTARSGNGRRDNDQNGSSGDGGAPATLADTLKVLFDKPQAAPPRAKCEQPRNRPIQRPRRTQQWSGASHRDASILPAAALPPKSALGVPAPDAAGKSAKPSPKSTRGLAAPGLPAPIEIGDSNHATSEILGIRLNSKAVQALQGMGFTVPPQPKTAFDVLLLTTPPGVSADQAQTMLREAMPKEKFETNKYYRNYQTRSSTGNAHSVTEASARPACTGSRCVARDLIKWSPENLGNCSAGVTVGVLDTSLDANHPAFVRAGDELVHSRGRAPAPTWHGTAVYALLAGNARSGTPGLIPNANIYHGSVFYTDAAGEVATDTHVLLSALDWMDRAASRSST